MQTRRAPDEPSRGLTALVGAALCLGALAVWWPALRNGFINYDDGGYVVQNLHVHRGLSWETVQWAFGTTRNGNWHPLTWLSHCLDCQWHGLNPAGHHLTSVLFHVCNTGLLFLALYRLTGAVWRSGWVAAFFALHPLRVESVAWVAERKDVLSAFFFLLTLLAYGRYAKKSEVRSPKPEGNPKLEIREEGDKLREPASDATLHAPRSTLYASILHPPSSIFYFLSFLFFALGLMSKPMVVTLPFVLLLLDYWPLCRFELSTLHSQPSTIWPLLREKLPFFALSAAASVVTFIVQSAGGNTESLPLSYRLSTTVVAYAGYIAKLLWPHYLAVFYPRPASWPLASVLGAAVLLAGVTAFVCWRGRTQRYLLTGWFWFLGMLVPVIGLVAIGEHALADRYTYLPSIGLLIALVWGLADLVPGHAMARNIVATLGLAALTACVLTIRTYLKQWANSLTLFEHALQVTENNQLAYLIAADCLKSAHEHNRAGEYCAKALLICPVSAPGWNLMAVLQAEEGKLDDALVCASNGIKAKPDWNAEAYFNRGTILLDLGRKAEARADFERAVKMNGEHLLSRINLATLLVEAGELDRAIEHYQAALRLDPGQAVCHYNLANALTRAGRLSEAIQHFEQSLRLDPANAGAQCNLAQALVRQQRTNEAITHFEAALQLDPTLAQAHYGVAVAAGRRGDTTQALAHLRLALQPNPDFPAALGEMAWILATDPDPAVRNGSEAVRAAERACELTRQNDAWLLATLAAAYAEAGRLGDATVTAERARDAATAGGQTEIIDLTRPMLEAFRAARTFHQAQPPQGVIAP
jgi:protein O-mannosyl-transferase